MDGSVLTEFVQSADCGAICYDLLGAIPDNINGAERIRYARAYIIEIIEGYLMPGLSQNLIHLRWLLKLVGFRTAGVLSWGSTVLAILY
ncbi:hypothetical protein Gotur_027379 [Gossypium turneri]